MENEFSRRSQAAASKRRHLDTGFVSGSTARSAQKAATPASETLSLLEMRIASPKRPSRAKRLAV
jgi:hypothetical protein